MILKETQNNEKWVEKLILQWWSWVRYFKHMFSFKHSIYFWARSSKKASNLFSLNKKLKMSDYFLSYHLSWREANCTCRKLQYFQILLMRLRQCIDRIMLWFKLDFAFSGFNTIFFGSCCPMWRHFWILLVPDSPVALNWRTQVFKLGFVV